MTMNKASSPITRCSPQLLTCMNCLASSKAHVQTSPHCTNARQKGQLASAPAALPGMAQLGTPRPVEPAWGGHSASRLPCGRKGPQRRQQRDVHAQYSHSPPWRSINHNLDSSQRTAHACAALPLKSLRQCMAAMRCWLSSKLHSPAHAPRQYCTTRPGRDLGDHDDKRTQGRPARPFVTA
jgi:hypothetical protein